MRIAICDDDTRELSIIINMLKKYKLLKNLEYSCEKFFSPVELIEKICSGQKYDIIILDIVMPILNGIDVAKEIREYDKIAKIIFVTSSLEFALQSYDVDAFYYAIKPVTENKFFLLLDDCFSEILDDEKKSIVIKCNQSMIRICLNNLEYCEVFNKTVIYHMIFGTKYENVGKMSDLEILLLKYPQFLKVHRSYIINMEYIECLEGNKIEMQSNIKISIPRGKIKHIKQSFLNYICSSNCLMGEKKLW